MQGVRLGLLGIAALAGLLAWPSPHGLAASPADRAAEAQAPLAKIAVDTDPTGNTATYLSGRDDCRSLILGTTIDIDVTVDSVPPLDDATKTGGIAAFGYTLLFNPSVVKVSGVNNSFLVAQGGGTIPFEVVDADANGGWNDGPLPGVTGNLRVDFVDLGPNGESGPGVLSRITVQAVGSGTSILSLRNGRALEDSAKPVAVTDTQDSAVAVGTPCQTLPPPLPVSALAIDADPAGNSARYVGAIDNCVSVSAGQTFDVDVVLPAPGIPGNGISSYFLALTFRDPTFVTPILQVVKQNAAMLLAAAPGSRLETAGSDAAPSAPPAWGFMSAAHDSGGASNVEPAGNSETGAGVLVRFTLKALAPGFASLAIDKQDYLPFAYTEKTPALRDSFGRTLAITSNQVAMVAVDNVCPSVRDVGSVELSTVPSGSRFDCGTSVIIIATVKDTAGARLPGETVTFAAFKSKQASFQGKLVASRITDADGQAAVTLDTGTEVGGVFITASAGIRSVQRDLPLQILGDKCLLQPSPTPEPKLTPTATPVPASSSGAALGLATAGGSAATAFPAALPKAGGGASPPGSGFPVVFSLMIAAALVLLGLALTRRRRRSRRQRPPVA